MRHFLDPSSSHLPFRWMASGAPHALHRFLVVRSLAAAIVLVGCVPAARYEEAHSAKQVAEEAQRRTEERLVAVEGELEALKQAHAAAQQRLKEYDAEASQAAFDRTHLEQERDEHAELVDQLRTELARVGDHLRVYSEDRATLSERLGEAQEEIEGLQQRLEELREASERRMAEAAERQAAQEPGTDGAAEGGAAEGGEPDEAREPRPASKTQRPRESAAATDRAVTTDETKGDATGAPEPVRPAPTEAPPTGAGKGNGERR